MYYAFAIETHFHNIYLSVYSKDLHKTVVLDNKADGNKLKQYSDYLIVQRLSEVLINWLFNRFPWRIMLVTVANFKCSCALQSCVYINSALMNKDVI